MRYEFDDSSDVVSEARAARPHAHIRLRLRDVRCCQRQSITQPTRPAATTSATTQSAQAICAQRAPSSSHPLPQRGQQQPRAASQRSSSSSKWRSECSGRLEATALVPGAHSPTPRRSPRHNGRARTSTTTTTTIAAAQDRITSNESRHRASTSDTDKTSS